MNVETEVASPNRSIDDAAGKLRQIFGFLADFEKLQNPVVRDLHGYSFVYRLEDIPLHPFITIPVRQGTSETDDFVLRVRRPKVTSPPGLDEPLADWVTVSQNPEFAPIRREALNVETEEGTVTENFDDSEDRVLVWPKWKEHWDRWAEAEKPNRIADRFFQQIYALHARLAKESEAYELVLGDGNLVCGEARINHPVVSQRVGMEFDPEKAEFTIRATDTDAELNTALLWELPEKVPAQILGCKKTLAAEGLSPSDPSALSPFLNRVIMVVGYGEFFESRPNFESRCYIFPSQVLYLRRRSGGFSEAITRIIEKISTLDELPPALVQICGIGNPKLDDEEEDRVTEVENHYGNERADILFTKAANREQVQIVERLNRHGTVIVQGPPGTGKSYTIGNVIGHLLAHGKRILVTAHTTKALKVVRNHVVEQLRALCVAVLDDDEKGRSELEKAVGAIAERLSSSDPRQLRREAAPLAERRERVMVELKTSRAKAAVVRSNEYRDVVFDGQSYSPSDAARMVKAGEGINDWIPAPIEVITALPIDVADVLRLYTTNGELTPEEERELAAKSPPLSELPTPSRFVELVGWLEQAEAADIATGSRFWNHEPRDEDSAAFNEIERLCELASQLPNQESWKFVVVAESSSSPELQLKWRDLVAAVRKVHVEANEFSRAAFEHGPEFTPIAGLSREDCLRHISDIEVHLKQHGRLSGLNLLLKPKWKAVLGSCKCNGRVPAKAEEMAALNGLLKVQASRELLKMRWERTMAPIDGLGGDHNVDEPERVLIHYASEIDSLADWNEKVFLPLQHLLASTGFDWDAFLGMVPLNYSAHGQLARIRVAVCEFLCPIIQARANLFRRQIASREMESATAAIKPVAQAPGASVLTHGLLDSVVGRNVETYAEWHGALVGLELKRPVFEARNDLLARVRNFAPAWSDVIRTRRGVHAAPVPPGDIKEAWKWRQLHDELDRRATQTPENLEKHIEQLSKQLFDLTGEVAEKLAWACQLEALEGNQAAKMSLIGWLQTFRRLGKGKVKAAAELKAAAREEMRRAKDAVPVWIMPLKKVLENFDPVEARFDVIIIDEASQCDMLGLVPLFMAKMVIVVGDHE